MTSSTNMTKVTLESILASGDKELKTIVQDWNQTSSPYRTDVTAHGFFEGLADMMPNATAVEYEDQSLTFAQLNAQANQLARAIRAGPIGAKIQANRDAFIALYLERDLHVVVAIFAILKAGAAYVPLDTKSPKDRNEMILQDANPVAILCNRKHSQVCDDMTCSMETTVVAVEEHVQYGNKTLLSDKDSTNLTVKEVGERTPQDLAYMIYTSGTTGKPKGCMIEHINLMNLTSAMGARLEHKVKRTLIHASFVFDASVADLFVGMFNGGTVIIAPERVRKDATLLGNFLVEKQIQWATIPPLLAQTMESTQLAVLDKLNLAGEAPPADLLDRVSMVTDAFNACGPSECTVCCSMHLYKPGDAPNNIGAALPNVKLYILDETMAPVKQGEKGELWIGGAGVGRGYLNRPELNQERFAPNPFGEPGRIYKTGDLVSWLPHGDVAIHGRIDRQVKIRGFRVELGEIESALTEMDGITQAVVNDWKRPTGSKALAAYLVGSLSPELAREQLKAKVPDYMVPTSFMVLDQIPLTINGKTDRDALPEPKETVERSTALVPPTNDLERQLCDIWAAVLNEAAVGITDNFFHSGGDSISCIHVTHKIRQAGLADLRANHIYAAPTIVELAKVIAALGDEVGATATEAEQRFVTGQFETLPIQDMFFDQWILPNKNHFNQDFTVLLPENHGYSTDAIQHALVQLARHHDMLRVVFSEHQNVCRSPDDKLPMEFTDQRGAVLTAAAKDNLQESSLDLEQGPVWRVVLHSERKVWFLFHHLMMDVVSWRILAEDFKSLLTTTTTDQATTTSILGPKTCSYQQWVASVRQYAQDHKEEQLPFWKKLAAQSPRNNRDPLAPTQTTKITHTVVLEPEHTTKLLKEAPAAYNAEMNDLLVSALNLALYQTTGQRHNAVNLEGIGRVGNNDKLLDVSRTVGWFTTLYPATLDASGDIANVIVNTKELLRSVPDKGLGYGALTQAGHLDDSLARVVFNYLGKLGSTADQADWSILVDESGEQIGAGNHDPRFSVEINGAVNQATGELFFDVSSYLDQDKTQQLCTALQTALVNVVEHACGVMRQNGPIKTPSDYSVPGLTVKRLEAIQAKYQGGFEALYAATSSQEAIVSHAVSHPDDDAYLLQMLYEFEGPLNVEHYAAAWGVVLQKYPSLRCAFDMTGSPAVMVVAQSVATPAVQVVDLRGKQAAAAVQSVMAEDRKQPFDLSQAGHLRVQALQMDHDKWTILVTMHHVSVDGWSQPVLQRDVSAAYDALVSTGKCDDDNLVKDDKAFYEAHKYIQQSAKDARDYWKGVQLNGANDMSFLFNRVYSEARNQGLIDQPAEDTLVMSAAATEQLQDMCRLYGVTVNAAVQFAFHKLLAIYSADDVTVIGTTVSGRDMPIEGLNDSVGMYINTLPLQLKWIDNATSVEMLKQTQERIGEIGTHGHMSLSEITQMTGEKPFLAVSVFDSFAESLENDAKEDKFKLKSVVEKLDLPLGLTAALNNGVLSLTLMYNRSWLSQERAMETMGQMIRMLEFVSLHPEATHEQVGASLVSESEKDMILNDWNQTDRPWRQDITAHGMFEEMVTKQPSELALVLKSDDVHEEITYKELNARANRLARWIRAKVGPQLDANPDSFIALFLDRDINTVVAILAVLKAGAGYLPIAPKNPMDRNKMMMEDAKPVALLTNASRMEQVQEMADGIPTLAVENVDMTLPSRNLEDVNRSPKDLAYMIYTSGTTGKPKGCMIEHRNILQLLQQHDALHGDVEVKRMLFFAAYVFDDSIYEIFVGLLSGFTLVIAPEEVRMDIIDLGNYLIEQKIDWAQFTPVLAQVMDLSYFKNIKKVMVGGEAPSLDLLTRVSKVTEIYNAIGPTECSVNCAIHKFKSGDLANNIGKPVANGKLYVLDKQMKPVPVGAPGELYVGGTGVGRGYLNRPELNAQRFVPNPFHPGKMYKTGDHTRWFPNGELQFLGRMDRQVKIRGFRIELGEIEAALNELKGVNQAVVVDVMQGKSKALAAYIKGFISADSARTQLAAKLPDYMVPSTYTFVDKIPLTVNGKLDTRALLLNYPPESQVAKKEQEIVAARNADEQQMIDLWAEVLGIDEISIFDNFFSLGGNSIQVAQLIALTNGRVNVKSLNEQRTLADLVAATAENKAKTIPKRLGADNLVPAPLSSGQKQFLVMDQLGTDVSSSFHFPWIAQLEKSADLERLKLSLRGMVDRHQILRTVYRDNEHGVPMQYILDADQLSVVEKQLDSDEDLAAMIDDDTKAAFDLESDLPTRLTIYHQQDGTRTLLLVIHHIAFDGWSLDVFLREWASMYSGESLPSLELQYADFAAWEQQGLEDITDGLEFWKKTLKDCEPVELPSDRGSALLSNADGAEIGFRLSAKMSQQLRAMAKRMETTMYAITLGAFQALLACCSGQDDVVLCSPVAERPTSDTQDMIGFFVNLVPLRTAVNPSWTFETFLEHVARTVVPQAIANAHVPFDKVVQHCLEGDRAYGSTPQQFQIHFSVQGFEGYSSMKSLPLTRPPDELMGYSPAQVDLQLTLNDEGEQVTGNFVWSKNVYSADFVGSLASRYERVLEAMVSTPNMKVKSVNLMTPEEERIVLGKGLFSNPLPLSDRMLSDVFESTAASNPDAVALVCGTDKITYRELNRRSNEFASRVRDQKDKTNSNSLVGLFFDKGIDMVVGIIGVLKAGAAYVPISKDWSQENIDGVLKDCGAEILVTSTQHMDRFSQASLTVLDVASSKSLDSSDLDQNQRAGSKSDMAYVVYDVADKLKGVVQTNENVVQLLAETSRYENFSFSNSDKFLFFQNYAVDTSVFELWSCFQCGGTLVIPEETINRDHEAIAALCEKELVTVLSSTPSEFGDIMPFLSKAKRCLDSLRYIIFSRGELNSSHLQLWWDSTEEDSKTQLITMYGTPETGYSTWSNIPRDSTMISAGRSLPHQKCLVLNSDMLPVPLGALGEIYIGGFGISPGYLNKPELDAVRFIADPFATTEDKERGMLRLFKTGDIGRWTNDRKLELKGQAKIGAIAGDGEAETSEVADTDKPRNELEFKLCQIWKEVLNVDEIGISDNFFRCGGDSIACLQVLFKIRKAGLPKLRAKEFYKAPTISSLAALIEASSGDDSGDMVKAHQEKISGSFETLPIQDDFFMASMPQPNHYNQAFTILLPKNHDITTPQLKTALAKLADHHDVLRCVFKEQQHFCKEEAQVELLNLQTAVATASMLSQLQAALDIEQGPVWRAVLHSGNKLWLAFHHLIIDVVSWRILCEDIQALLTGMPLGPKTCSYKQWVDHVKSYARKHNKAQTQFWTKMQGEGTSVLVDATDSPHSKKLQIGSETTLKLIGDAHGAYNTEVNDLLLTALGRALSDVTGNSENTILLEGIGRVSDDVDVSRTVGWFTVMYPVCLDGAGDAGDSIVRTKEMLRSVPDKGLGYGSLMQAGHLKDKAIPVVFNYLGQLGGSSADSEWSIAMNEETGQTIAPGNRDSGASLEINCVVNMTTSKLEIEMTSYLEKSVTDKCCSSLATAIEEVVNHASGIQQVVKTPSDYLIPNLTMDWLGGLEARFPGEIEALYYANSLQQAFIAHAVSNPDDFAYCSQCVLNYKGKLDVELYRQSWELMVKQYPTLRCGFDWEGPAALMVVMKEVQSPPFEVIDLRSGAKSLAQIREEDQGLTYDLAKPPLIRIKAIQLGDEEWTILFCCHHVVLDGWSMPLLLDNVSETYFNLSSGGTPKYKVDNGFHNGHEYRMNLLPQASEYWGKVTLGSQNDISLMMNPSYSEAADKSLLDRPAEAEITLDASVVQKMKSTLLGHGVTMTSAVNFAWSKLLQTYSGDDKTILGLTVSGREMPAEGIESSVGMFINTLPLMVEWQTGMGSMEVLKLIQSQMADLTTYSQVPLLDIIKKNGEAPFNTVVVYENYPDAAGKGEEAFTVDIVDEKIDVPLGLTAVEANGSLRLTLMYNLSWLSEEGAVELLQQVSRIMEYLSENPSSPHEEAGAAAVSKDDLDLMLYKFNEKEESYRQDITLHRRFEEMVTTMPDAIALEYEDEKVTYAELNARANQIASVIRATAGPQIDASSEPFVALYMNRNVDMVASILGVLKSGAAYCPMATDNATERSQMILDDVCPVALVTNDHFCQRLKTLTEVPILAVESIDHGLPGVNLDVECSPSDLAYILYTSGTTGIPKGCMIEHRNVQFLASAQWPFTHGDGIKKTLFFAAYMFDVSVLELYCSLFNGCTIVLASDELRKNVNAIGDFITEKEVDWAFFTPTVAKVLDHSKMQRLKKVHFGGEASTLELLNSVSKYTEAWNVTGPSETTVYTSCHCFTPGDASTNVGKPMANVKLYVLNEQLKPVPIGAPGELCIGGEGVGRGYRNRPELHKSKFIDNPFAPGRLYRSGDLVKWDSSGEMHILGRMDTQVKIRGYRIECGEVESAIKNLEGIEHVAVIDALPATGGNKFLAAYIVGPASPDVVRSQLTKRLPAYMIPSTFNKIEKIPLTFNGKLDRKALPAPDRSDQKREMVLPRTEEEKKMCELWSAVLGIEDISIEDNFFSLGGNSLDAAQLVALSKGLVSVKALHQNRTLESLVAATSSVEDHGNMMMTVSKRPGADDLAPAPLSAAQKRLLVIDRLGSEESSTYHIPYVAEIEDGADIGKLKDTLKTLVNRHHILRTVYRDNSDGTPMQHVVSSGRFEVAHKEVAGDENIKDVMTKDVEVPFSLHLDVPTRATIYTQGSKQFLLLNFHHIAFDGWSLDVFLKEWDTLYTGGSLAPLAIQYADVAVWEAEQLKGDSDGIAFWKKNLDGAEPIDLGSDVQPTIAPSTEGVEIPFKLGNELSEQVRALAKELGTTVFTVTLSAFFALMSRFSGQEDLIIGSPVSDRPMSQTQDMVGYFVNNMALRTKYDDNWSIRDFVKHVRDTVVANAMANSNVPFDVIVNQCLGADRTPGYMPPHFQIQFTLDRFAGADTIGSLPLNTPKESFVESSSAKFDLLMTLDDEGEEIIGDIEFRKNKFSSEYVECLTKQYTLILEQFTAFPTTQLKSMELTTDEERQKLVYDWNDTAMPYDKEMAIHKTIEAVANATPGAIALESHGEELSYGELNARANRMARMIRAIQGGQIDNDSDCLIALYLERNLNMIVAILAVLKSGCAYVPILPDKATDRAQMILEDAKPVAVLTNTEHQGKVQSLVDCPVLSVEGIPKSLPSSNLDEVNRSGEDLAYCLYTSGTTGKPKGCMIEHRNIQYITEALKAHLNVNKNKKCGLFTSYTFDVSIGEIFYPLVTGKTIVILPEEVRKDSVEYGEFIVSKNLGWSSLTPSYAQLIDPSKFRTHDALDVGGEAPSLELLENVSKYTEVWNSFGPTEACVYCCKRKFQHGDLHSSIGKPLPNAMMYVLNDKLEPLPVGAPGELYIGGAGVARGYRNRPELNSDKFLENPFVPGRLYKSGDRVRKLPNGETQFMGRIDRQVKIRGFRIELAEIESAIKGLEGVDHAIVVDVMQGKNKTLAAYVVGSLSTEDAAAKLAARLPDYMIPASFTKIDTIPVTSSGKLDKKALPEPNVALKTTTAVKPQTAIEQQLCQLWTEVLSLDEIGITDNFFHIGGDSIGCLQVLYKMRAAGLGDFRAKDFYKHNTVQAMATLIQTKSKEESSDMVKPDQGQITGTFGTLLIQDYFYGLNFPKPNHFNQSFTMFLPKGHDVSTEALNDAVMKLAQHHDILRCVFNKDRQHLCKPTEEAPVEILDIRDSVADEKMLTELQSSLDLESGPLWKVVLHSQNKLWMVFHHMIIDGVSWRIISEDMQAFLTGKPVGPKTCSYKQWVEHMNGYAEKHGEAQIPFWKKMGTANTLPFAARAKEPTLMEMKLSSKHTSKLLTEAHRAYNTEINDLLLAALAKSLVAVSGNSENSITLEGIGRVSDELDLSRTVGWFTTMYPLSLNGSGDLGNIIAATKERLRSVPDKGLGYSALVKSGNIADELAPVVFNYLGQLGSSSGQTADWAIAVDEETGKEIADENHSSRYTLEINGEVNMATGELVLGMRSLLGADITKKFHDAFQQTLVEVVEHTCSIEVPQKTPSDYSVPDMTVEWLRNIESKFNEHDIEALYSATGLQQTFVAHALSHPEDDAYSVQLVFDVLSELDLNSYQRAWDSIIKRFPAMRCAFHWSGPSTVMVVLREASMPKIKVVDLNETGQTLEEARIADRMMGFDLSKPCPLRATVVQESSGKKTIVVSMHHAIVDGWSTPLILEALNTAYVQEKAGKTPDFNPDKAFFAAQEHRTQTMAEAREYWGKMDFGSPNDLRYILNDEYAKAKSIELDRPSDVEYTMDSDSLQSLKKTCRSHGLTLNVATQFAWHKLLQMYTGESTTTVGTVDSGRDKPVDGINSSVGLYINTLPLMVEWKTGASTLSMLQQLQDRIMEMGTYSQMPLSEIMAKSSSAESLFHTVSVFENYPDSGEDTNENFAIQNAVEKLDVPLGLMACEEDGELLLRLKYNMSWLDEDRAKELLIQVSRILSHIAQSPDASHEEAGAAAMSREENRLILEEWNQTAEPYHSNETIHCRFEKTVAEMPDAIALEFGDEKITYSDLNARANRMAIMIRAIAPQLDTNRDAFIALYLDRDVNMIVAMLAVLKAGGAYVPIAPDNATERCQMILEDSNPVAVLTNKHYTEKLQGLADVPMLSVETVPEMLPSANLNNVSRLPNDLAYVIYTSGTTGKPKGCMIEHHNVQYIADAQGPVTHGEDVARTLFFAAYVFDATTIELYRSLFTGSTIVMAPEELRKDPSGLGDFLVEKRIDFLFITPKLAEVVEPTKFSNVKKVNIGGEAPSLDLLSNVSKHAQECWNVIGPTECTGYCAAHLFQEGDPCNNVGRPLANVYAYILDEQQKPVPLGAPGELYVGGEGVGRGYIRRPELNAEKFLPNPFHTGRMYRTGDACRFFPNGDLEFLGRTDRQVKIRGFRLELGEVEAAIQKLEGVEQAAVIDVVQGKNKFLAAYIAGSISMEDVGPQLSARLPSYMIPSSFTSVEKVPVTINGKLDRKALPEPTVMKVAVTAAPKTRLEKELCEIFADVLDLEAVGVTDDFFTSGGNSISAVDLVYKIQAAGIGDMKVKDLYSAPTVADIIEFVGEDEEDDDVSVEEDTFERRVSKRVSFKDGLLVTSELDFDESDDDDEEDDDDSQDTAELLPVQDWFLDLDLPNENQCCEAFTLCLPEDHEYSIEDIEDALEELQKNHEMLRCTFEDKKVTCRPAEEVPVSFQDMRENELPEKVLGQLMNTIDIEDGPVWHAVLHSGFKLFMVFHQLVIDDVSCTVIAEELCALLNGKTLKQESCAYTQWGDYLVDYAEMNGMIQGPFWDKMVGTPNKFLTPAMSEPSTVPIELAEEVSNVLLNKAGRGGNENLGKLLLASLSRALSTVTGGGSTSVSLANSGRVKDDIDVTRTVGCFYNSFPAMLKGAGNVKDTLKQVEKVLNAIPDQGIGYQSMVKEEDVTDVKPQVQLALAENLWSSCSLEPGWSVIPYQTSETSIYALGMNDPDLALNVLFSVHPETNMLGLKIMSRLSDEKTAAFCEALKHSLQDSVDYLSGKTRKPLKLFRKKGGLKKQKSDKALHASRIVRIFKESLFDNEYMFFIHPGGSDAAVYKTIAEDLYGWGFNPKGIDNDVLVSFKKYEMAKNLGDLAQFYADLIVPSMKKAAPGAPIKLFGWSLGGKIALETAHILEKQGHTKIFVYVIDSFMNLSSLGADHETLVEESMDEFLSTRRKGLIDQKMLDAHQNVVDSEYKLAEQALSGKLKHSKVTLFKAGKEPEGANHVMKRGVESFDNGLSKCARKFNVITFKDHDHNSIIEARERIIDVIVQNRLKAGSLKRDLQSTIDGMMTGDQFQVVNAMAGAQEKIIEGVFDAVGGLLTKD